MAISEPYLHTGLTVSTTELSMINSSPSAAASSTIATETTDGAYQVFLDLNALAAGDLFELKIYEKAQAAATQRVVYSVRFAGAQGAPVWASPTLMLIHGWDYTLKKISGTDRSIPYSIRKA